MIPLRRLTVAAALVSAAGFLPGCYAEAHPAALTSAEVDYGYVPAYYDGYVVYYDTVGQPYYYDGGGAVVWISPASPYYVGLRNHWHTYGHAYPRWYSSYGHRYRGYRAAPGYHGYGGYRGGAYHAPPAYRGGGTYHAPPAYHGDGHRR